MTSEATRYRRKPVVIEAIRYDGLNHHDIELWSKGTVFASPVLEPTRGNPTGQYLQVRTLGGVTTAIVGDWIIKGVTGEFHPCKPDIFALSCEEVKA